MSERLFQRGVALSAAVVLGLGAIGCSSESDNNHDKVTKTVAPAVNCKETRVSPEITAKFFTELARANTFAISDIFLSHGIHNRSFIATSVTCDQELPKAKLNTATTLIRVERFVELCLPTRIEELPHTSPPLAPPSTSNTLFAICPNVTLSQ